MTSGQAILQRFARVSKLSFHIAWSPLQAFYQLLSPGVPGRREGTRTAGFLPADHSFIFFNIYLLLLFFREKGMEGEREGKKH